MQRHKQVSAAHTKSCDHLSRHHFPIFQDTTAKGLWISPNAGPRLILTKVSSLKAREEQELRRGKLHTDAVRHAVGGSSLRLATWAALGCPPHHVIVITWYDGPTPSSPSVPHRSPLDDTCPNMFSPSPGLAGRETTNVQCTCDVGKDEVIIIMRSTFLKRY